MKKSKAPKEEEEEEEESPTSLKALEADLVEAEKDLADAKKEVKEWSSRVKEANIGSPEEAKAKELLANAKGERDNYLRRVERLEQQIKEEKEAGLFACFLLAFAKLTFHWKYQPAAR